MKWEYCIATAAPGDEKIQLNDYGNVGWELVQITADAGGVCCVFKRPIPSETKVEFKVRGADD